jgi:hypothetical protein
VTPTVLIAALRSRPDPRIWSCLVVVMGFSPYVSNRTAVRCPRGGTKAIRVLKGDRLTMAVIAVAVRGKRPVAVARFITCCGLAMSKAIEPSQPRWPKAELAALPGSLAFAGDERVV